MACGDRRRRLRALLDRTRDDPDLFNSAILGRPPLWWRQCEIGRSVVENYATVVCSGNATGKDYMVGGIVPWWLSRSPGSLVIVTGPSQTLLGTVTWKEVRKAIRGSLVPLGMHVSDGAKSSPHLVNVADGWQALGYSTTSVERASGQHAKELLVIVEEASGVEDEIWEALDSLKYKRILAIGNPIRATGRFVEMCRQHDTDLKDKIPASRRTNRITIPSTDSPHATWDESPYGLADKTWLAAMARKYGKDSAWYRSHVLAIIPEVDDNTLIPVAWLDRAAAVPCPDRRMGEGGPRRLGVDLGEGVGRDRTVFVVRDDLGVLECRGDRSLGLEEAAAEMHRLGQRWQISQERMTFDGAGIGRDLPKHLARYGITARAYFGAASGGRDFTNLRTAAAWKLRMRLDPSGSDDADDPFKTQAAFHFPGGPYWEHMRGDLKELRYELVERKTKLETKEDVKARLGHSPDFGDAIVQTFSY